MKIVLKQLSNKCRSVTMLLACMLVYVFFVPYVHGGMTSTNYSLSPYGIGGTERVQMSSANYTLSRNAKEEQVPQEPTIDPVVQEDARTSSGSKRRMLSIIAASTTSFGIREESQESPVVLTQVSNNELLVDGADTGLSVVNTIPSGQTNSVQDSESPNKAAVSENNQLASVIGAGFLADRSHRVMVFGALLALLLYVRSYTKIGKKYRPF